MSFKVNRLPALGDPEDADENASFKYSDGGESVFTGDVYHLQSGKAVKTSKQVQPQLDVPFDESSEIDFEKLFQEYTTKIY